MTLGAHLLVGEFYATIYAPEIIGSQWIILDCVG